MGKIRQNNVNLAVYQQHEQVMSVFLNEVHVLIYIKVYMMCACQHDMCMLLTHDNLGKISESGAKYSEIT